MVQISQHYGGVDLSHPHEIIRIPRYLLLHMGAFTDHARAVWSAQPVPAGTPALTCCWLLARGTVSVLPSQATHGTEQ